MSGGKGEQGERRKQTSIRVIIIFSSLWEGLRKEPLRGRAREKEGRGGHSSRRNRRKSRWRRKGRGGERRELGKGRNNFFFSAPLHQRRKTFGVALEERKLRGRRRGTRRSLQETTQRTPSLSELEHFLWSFCCLFASKILSIFFDGNLTLKKVDRVI